MNSKSLRDRFRTKKRAYSRIFDGADGEVVLTDLKKFCRADMSTFEVDDPNGRVSALREGRREVWLRINKYLNLTEAEIDRFNEN